MTSYDIPYWKKYTLSLKRQHPIFVLEKEMLRKVSQ